jgi:hypothetical protein
VNGPHVNVKQGYGAFKSSYLTAEDSLRKLVTQYINADVQAQLGHQVRHQGHLQSG